MNHRPSKEEIDQFINALQLSIASKISRWKIAEPYLLVDFDLAKDDEKLNLFLGLMGPDIIRDKQFFFKRTDADKPTQETENATLLLSDLTPTLTQFLLLTRLDRENMEKLAKRDPQYRLLVSKIGRNEPYPPESHEIIVGTISDAAPFVFRKAKEAGASLRVLSEKTGLSTMALGKIKKGGDLRLSSLIKLCAALGLRLKITQ